ncbi:MAG: hypothetical protein OXG30_11635, partial [bacterium]|nr:hypothetical protein [bacterium]
MLAGSALVAGGQGASAQTAAPAVPDADAHVVPGDWALKPSGLGAGDRFRLMFRTTSRWAATATDIATYDGYVQSELTKSANTLAAIKPYAPGFKAVGSTQTVDVRDHLAMHDGTAFRDGVPVYWMDSAGGGKLVADDYQDFCNREGNSSNPEVWWQNDLLTDQRDENGQAFNNDNNWPWTGSSSNCTKRANRWLGHNTDVEIGAHRDGRTWGPLSNGRQAPTNTNSLYAMSPEFIVAGPIHVSLSA